MLGKRSVLLVVKRAVPAAWTKPGRKPAIQAAGLGPGGGGALWDQASSVLPPLTLPLLLGELGLTSRGKNPSLSAGMWPLGRKGWAGSMAAASWPTCRTLPPQTRGAILWVTQDTLPSYCPESEDVPVRMLMDTGRSGPAG